ncbi:hypothetical protein HR12_37940 [Microbacterium sp. SUBG005]|nr:hypothetical protein HR12_37940 [Microbacterium sp. SUBG005]
MAISVENRPTAVNELLWVRAAYGLEVEGDVPPALLDTPDAAGRILAAGERARWTAVWPRLWEAAVRHAARPTDTSALESLVRPNLPPEERAVLLARVAGPSWRDEFGDEVFDDPSFEAWNRRSFEAVSSARPRALDAHPERRVVDALTPAWRRGLRVVVVLACAGAFTRSLGSTGLLVTAGTRSDDATYREALSSFSPR